MVGRVSDRNVEVVRRALEHYLQTGQLLEEALDPDFVWDMSTFVGWPEQPEFTGPDGLRQFIEIWQEPWDDWRMQLDELHDCGDDRVLALLRQSGKPHGSDSAVHLAYGMLHTLLDGRISRIHVYATLDEARQAAALSA